jgi:hypothetical protein
MGFSSIKIVLHLFASDIISYVSVCVCACTFISWYSLNKTNARPFLESQLPANRQRVTITR